PCLFLLGAKTEQLTNPLTGKKRKTSNNITWGDLKALNDEASRMMQHVGAEPNATNAFLAYLAIVSEALAGAMEDPQGLSHRSVTPVVNPSLIHVIDN
uniref:Uncharacterized protein n=1 Tax=Catharus ustulatus TaxID=91951 RepID=A0A8C3V3H7_CATUS